MAYTVENKQLRQVPAWPHVPKNREIRPIELKYLFLVDKRVKVLHPALNTFSIGLYKRQRQLGLWTEIWAFASKIAVEDPRDASFSVATLRTWTVKNAVELERRTGRPAARVNLIYQQHFLFITRVDALAYIA